jgi:hypothetical protein
MKLFDNLDISLLFKKVKSGAFFELDPSQVQRKTPEKYFRNLKTKHGN